MKTKLSIILLIFFTTALNAEYFFDDFSSNEKMDTALSYLMVSEQFLELGDKSQAEKYKKMAYFIYPELEQTDSNEINNQENNTSEPTETVIRPSDKSAEIRYYFSKLLRSLITGDLETADTLIAERLYLPEYSGGLTKSQLNPMVISISEKYNLSTFMPEDLYKLDSISVKKIEEGTYHLTIEGADNDNLYTSGITFFGRVQTYQFRHYENGWKVDKITKDS